MSKVIQTCNIKKFGFEIGEGYTVIINLERKLESLHHRYMISIHSANKEQMLINDENEIQIQFPGFVLKDSGFREIKFKIDGETVKKLIDIKHKDLEKIGITLESISL